MSESRFYLIIFYNLKKKKKIIFKKTENFFLFASDKFFKSINSFLILPQYIKIKSDD